MDLLAQVGKHVYRRNGVLTEFQSFGTVQLGYGIKKLDGRYYEGRMSQMTMMTPPSFNSELYYLNKEDRLLRWLLIKHRDTDLFSEDDGKSELRGYRSNTFEDYGKSELWSYRSSIFKDDNMEEDGDDDDDADYESEQSDAN